MNKNKGKDLVLLIMVLCSLLFTITFVNAYGGDTVDLDLAKGNVFYTNSLGDTLIKAGNGPINIYQNFKIKDINLPVSEIGLFASHNIPGNIINADILVLYADNSEESIGATVKQSGTWSKLKKGDGKLVKNIAIWHGYTGIVINVSKISINLRGAARSGDSRQPLSSPGDPIIVSNFNTAGVQSGPTYTTAFTLKVPYRITYLHNYHYFNNGKLPGTIALRHDDGTMYGPWQAEGAAGYGNVPNGYWVVRPNIEIKPGRYTVIDSDKPTWSYNAQSKGSGFVEIRGVKLAAQNAQPQDRQEKPTASGEKARDGRFIAYNNGTVLDSKTGLMWAAKDNGSLIIWQGAKSYCENYRGGGYSDWRMPTQNELAGLYDVGKSYKNDFGSVVYLTEFIRLSSNWAWASETRGSEATWFSFIDGSRGWGSQSSVNAGRVLPVRSGR